MTSTAVEIDDAIDGEIVDDLECETDEQIKARMERDRVTLYTNGLRRLADFLDERPALCPASAFDVSRWADNKADLSTLLKLLGAGEKIANDWQIGVKRSFGPHKLGAMDSRSSTCTKKVLSTKDVTKTVDSETDVPETAKNVRTITVTKVVYDDTEEETEWECPASLLDGETAALPAPEEYPF